MKTFLEDGQILKGVAGAAFNPGDLIMLGRTPIIAMNGGAIGDVIVGAAKGVYQLPADASAQAATVGTFLYWNGTQISTSGSDIVGVKWYSLETLVGHVPVKLEILDGLIPLPSLTGLIGAWLFFENQDGYTNGQDMDVVTARVGPDLVGSPNPPTWDDIEKAARYTYTVPNYFRAPMTAGDASWQLVAAGARFAIHDIMKYTDVPGTFETILSTAALSSENGVRLFRTTTTRRLDVYPDVITEQGGTYTNQNTQYLVRTVTYHSDVALDASFARYLYHENGANTTDGSDASAHFAGNSPMAYDVYCGCLPSLGLPLDARHHSRFIQTEYDDDFSRNNTIKTWFEALP